jgi:hypothetical protein
MRKGEVLGKQSRTDFQMIKELSEMNRKLTALEDRCENLARKTAILDDEQSPSDTPTPSLLDPATKTSADR